MKINWSVRLKNPYFWIGLLGVIFTAMGVEPSTLTSWQAVIDSLKSLISNPYMIVAVIIAILGVVNDPTTAGIKDSNNALTYSEPKK